MHHPTLAAGRAQATVKPVCSIGTTLLVALGLAEHAGRREAFRAYMRDLLRQRRASMRSLSLQLTEGKDAAYVQQFISGARNRALPTPDQCRIMAEVLEVPFIEVLQGAWGIPAQEMAQEFNAITSSREANLQLAELTELEFEQVKEFVTWTRARRKGSRVERSMQDN